MSKRGDDFLPELDPLIHPQARLQVMTSLSSLSPGERVAFTRLQEALGLSPGNLSAHLGKLEEADYVKITKGFRGRRPVTWVQLTRRGRDAFGKYLDSIEQYIRRNDGR